jgi:predicted metal-dependent peptidase
MIKENIHPKYSLCLEQMMIDSEVDLPYYGYFNQPVNFFEKKNDPAIKTAGVNVTVKGMNHYYNPDFVDSLTQKQVNFLILHETFHLLFNHPKRTRMGGFDHELSNIAQDMIINQILVKDILPSFLDIPKNEEGKNTALFIPNEYEGEWIFEELYDWLRNTKEETQKRRDKKDDEKLFAELFSLANEPNLPSTSNYHGEFNRFCNILIEKSKEECTKYMSNFVRRCLVSFENGQDVYLYGHTSTVTPPNVTDPDYNQKLSEKRAELFKNAVIENIDLYMDTYAYCLVILDEEKGKLSDTQKIAYIIKYEEISNKTLIKQREKDLKESIKNANPMSMREVDALFETYRMTELNKIDDKTLHKMTVAKGLTPPNITQEKLKWVQTAQNMLIAEGKGDTELIITNELEDDEESVIRKELAHLPQYKPYKYITDTELKQGINRRVTYKFDESFDNSLGGGSSPESQNQANRDGYGQNAKDGQEGYGLDGLFDKMAENDGEFLDNHIPDTVSEEMREQMVKDIQERLKSRGLSTGNIETTLNRLKKKRKDYLKEIKRGITFIKGSIKYSTIKRPSRRGMVGIKGRKKHGSIINVVLDTSGSMGGYFDKALSFIFRSDIEINLIQCDTQVQCSEKIKSKSELEKVKIQGLGGTVMQPGIDYMKENFPQYSTLMLTDGYTDSLDFSGYKGKVLIISNGSKCPIEVSNGKIKQILVDDDGN